MTSETDIASARTAFAEWLEAASENEQIIYGRFMSFALRAYQQRYGTIPRLTLSERNGVREWLPKRGLQGMRADFAKALRNGMIAPEKDRPFSIFLRCCSPVGDDRADARPAVRTTLGSTRLYAACPAFTHPARGGHRCVRNLFPRSSGQRSRR